MNGENLCVLSQFNMVYSPASLRAASISSGQMYIPQSCKSSSSGLSLLTSPICLARPNNAIVPNRRKFSLAATLRARKSSSNKTAEGSRWASVVTIYFRHMRGKGFLGQTRRERRAYPLGICKERATKSGPKRPAAPRVAPHVSKINCHNTSTDGFSLARTEENEQRGNSRWIGWDNFNPSASCHVVRSWSGHVWSNNLVPHRRRHHRATSQKSQQVQLLYFSQTNKRAAIRDDGFLGGQSIRPRFQNRRD